MYRRCRPGQNSGGNPVIALPGLTPRFPGFAAVPVRMLEPVLVTVEAPNTAKLPTVPRTGACCAWLGEVRVAPIRPRTATAPRTPDRFSDDVRTDAVANENLLI